MLGRLGRTDIIRLLKFIIESIEDGETLKNVCASTKSLVTELDTMLDEQKSWE